MSAVSFTGYRIPTCSICYKTERGSMWWWPNNVEYTCDACRAAKWEEGAKERRLQELVEVMGKLTELVKQVVADAKQ